MTAVETEVEIIHLTDAWQRDIVMPAATYVYSRFGDYVELDDLVGEAMVWWYSKGQRYLAEYLQDEDYLRLRRSIWRWCLRFAELEKATKVGYRTSDQYDYPPARIVAILPIALDPEGVPPGQVHDDSGGGAPHGNLAEGGDALAALVDVRRALSALEEDDLHFLSLADLYQLDWDRLGAYLAILPDSARRRHARIAERMSRWLNREDPIT